MRAQDTHREIVRVGDLAVHYKIQWAFRYLLDEARLGKR